MIPSVTASEAGTVQSENPRPWAWELWSRVASRQVALEYKSLLRQRAEEGNSPVTILADSCYRAHTESRVARDCSTKREVISF